MKLRLKNHKIQGMAIISKYKAAIEVLRKRQEKVALVHALKELGSLNCTLGNLAQAEEMWSDSLDTIFQKIYTLKNSAFRKVLADCQTNGQLLAHVFGPAQCLVGLNLCATLANNCYFNNCH